METKKRIWEGSVGIVMEPRPNKDGEYFWTYRFTRYYKQGEESRYDDSFTDRNTEALGKVMSQGIQFMEQNDAGHWLEQQAAAA